MTDALWRDLRYGLRRLARAPMFTLFSILTLTIGIGITTAAYSLVYQFVLRDVGVRDGARLFSIHQANDDIVGFSWPEYRDVVDQQSTFSGVAAWTSFSSALTGIESTELISAEAVSGNFFPTLGVEAQRGRLLQPDDDHPTAPAVAVLSDLTWRRQFNTDPNIVGTSVRMAGAVFEVVGVAAPSFYGASPFGRSSQGLWIPLAHAPGRGGAQRLGLRNREERTLNVIARLERGQAVATAEAQLAVIAERLEAVSPRSKRPGETRRMLVAPAFDGKRLAGWKMQSLFLLAIPALVLLVACTNLMNLALSRGMSRHHEFAVRRALGASRLQVVREQLSDGVIVAVAGGLGGVLAARGFLAFGNGLISDTFGAWPQFGFESRIEPAVLVAAGGAAVLSLIVSNVLPALQLTKRAGNRLTADSAMAALPRWRSQANLIALQVTVSVGLFLVTALGVNIVASEQRESESVGLDRLALVDVPLAHQQYDERRGRDAVARVRDAMRRTAGVEAVEIASMISPFHAQPMTSTLAYVTAPGRPLAPRTKDGERLWLTVVTPGAFELVGPTIQTGRSFDARDSALAAPVVIINAGLARTLLGRTDVAGQDVLVRFEDGLTRPGPRLLTVVGVAADAHDSAGTIRNEIYVPYAQHFEWNVSFLVRGQGSDVRSLVTSLREAVRRADPDIAISFAGRADLARRSMTGVAMGMMTSVMGSLALVALILAMAGLYGVLSHVVAKRTRELGLRMALGASRARIVRMVLKDGFRPVVEGLVIGLGSALVIRQMLQMSFDKPARALDPMAFALAAVPLLVAAAIACYLPARRAAGVEPNVALRDL